MAVAGFNTLLESMAAMDFFTGVLPFVLTYVVLYAALDQVPVIKEKDNFPPLIAIIGAFFVARFIVVNPVYQSFFVDYFGQLVIGLMGFIGLLILLAFTGYNLGDKGGLKTPLVVMLMVVIVGAAFTTSGGLGFMPPSLAEMGVGQAIRWSMESGLVWILVVAGALWWASSDGSGSKKDYMVPFFNNDWWKGMMDDD